MHHWKHNVTHFPTNNNKGSFLPQLFFHTPTSDHFSYRKQHKIKNTTGVNNLRLDVILISVLVRYVYTFIIPPPLFFPCCVQDWLTWRTSYRNKIPSPSVGQQTLVHERKCLVQCRSKSVFWTNLLWANRLKRRLVLWRGRVRSGGSLYPNVKQNQMLLHIPRWNAIGWILRQSRQENESAEIKNDSFAYSFVYQQTR